jgi:hypothetical protein
MHESAFLPIFASLICYSLLEHPLHAICVHLHVHMHSADLVRRSGRGARVLSRRENPVAPRPARLLARGWVYVPAASGPIGGGLIKLGRGSTQAAVAVSLAPYAIWALLLAVFVIGYLAALTRFLCAGAEGQEAMERLVGVTASAVVTVLTLTVATAPASRAPAGPPAPRPRGTETARNPGNASQDSAARRCARTPAARYRPVPVRHGPRMAAPAAMASMRRPCNHRARRSPTRHPAASQPLREAMQCPVRCPDL